MREQRLAAWQAEREATLKQVRETSSHQIELAQV